jgi:hypothetical protein
MGSEACVRSVAGFLGADSEYLLACLSSTTASFGWLAYSACIATPAIQHTSYAQALDLIALIMRAV